MTDVCVVGRDDGCLLDGGESVWNGVIFTFFPAGLVGQGPGGFSRFLTFPFLSRITLDLPPQPRVLLPKRFHLINTTLFQVDKLLLHLGLAFKDGAQVRGDVSRYNRSCFRVLHDSSVETVLEGVRIAW